MPKKVTGEKLEKVISSTISAESYRILQQYAREYYTQGKLPQPTISHLVRGIVNNFIDKRTVRQGKAAQSNPTQAPSSSQ